MLGKITGRFFGKVVEKATLEELFEALNQMFDEDSEASNMFILKSNGEWLSVVDIDELEELEELEGLF